MEGLQLRALLVVIIIIIVVVVKDKYDWYEYWIRTT
jgi:hypothetical protein